MGIVVRQSVKTSMVVLFGAVLGAFTLWLSTRFIVNQQDFGFTKNLTSQALTLSQILLFGLSGTLFVYTHRYPDDLEKKKVLLTLCLSLPMFLTTIVTIAYFFLKQWVINHFQPADRPLMSRYYIWLPIYTVLFIYLIILEQYLAVHMKVAISAFMREVVLRLLNIGIILMYAFGLIGFHSLVVASILIYVVPISAFLYLCFTSEGFGFSLNFKSFSMAEYRDIFHFTWYHFLMSISIILMSYLDVLLLPLYNHSGLVSVAVYSVSVFIISFLQMPSKAFLPATFSILTTAFTENDLVKAKDIFIRSSLNVLIPTVALAVLLCSNLDNAVAILGNGKNYAGISGVFLVLLIGQMINLSTGINDQILSITNYYKFTFYASAVITIILFCLIRFLVPLFGILGAAWSTTISVGLFNIAKFIFIWKKVGMQPFTKNTLLVLICGIPSAGAGYYLPHFSAQIHPAYVETFIDAAVRSLIVVILYVAMLLWLRPSSDLTSYVASIKKNRRLF